MRSKLTLFAAVCVAAFALSTPAGAATILSFSQPSSTDFVMATVVGNITTLDTNGGVGTSNSIPITIGQLGGATGVNIPATETFFPALSSSIAATGIPGGSGVQQVGFNGTIVIGIAGDPNVLTAVITNGRLAADGGSGGFSASSFTTNGNLPTTVTLTSDNPAIIAAMGGSGSTFTTSGAVALSLVGIVPIQGGSGFSSFRAQNTGNFSTAVNPVPEPAGFLSAGTAILAGFGCFGWSRRKSSKA
jgi:hypothetical protein